jgi:hypothetical protein
MVTSSIAQVYQRLTGTRTSISSFLLSVKSDARTNLKLPFQTAPHELLVHIILRFRFGIYFLAMTNNTEKLNPLPVGFTASDRDVICGRARENFHHGKLSSNQ